MSISINVAIKLLEHIATRLEAAHRAHDWGFIEQAVIDLRDLKQILRKGSSSSSSLSANTPAGGDDRGEQDTGGPAQSAAQNAGAPAAVEADRQVNEAPPKYRLHRPMPKMRGRP